MLVYMAVTMITPGPNNLTMMFLGSQYGLKGTRKFLIASTICLFIKTLLCGFLNLGFASIMPSMIKYLKWLGAAYMVYLGWTMAKSGFQDEEKHSGAEQTESNYRSGIILQLLNMKSWVTCITLYAVYIIPHTASTAMIIWPAFAYTVFMIASSLCWGGFGSAMRKFVAKYRKPFGIVMGLSLLYCAVTAVI